MVSIVDQKLAEEVNSVILVRGKTEKVERSEFLLKKLNAKV